jgi:hypothetical protein
VFSSFSLEERQGDRDDGVSSFCGVPALGSSPLFPFTGCFHTPLAHSLALTATRKRQASSCLPRHRQAVRLQCVTDVSIAGPPCSSPEERAPLIAIACPMLSSLDERQWIETMAFHCFAACPSLNHHRCFLSLDVSTLCLLTSPRSPQPASDCANSCLPGNKQAVRLQCFCHWRVTDAFTAGPPCPPPGERAVLIGIA